MYPITKDVPVKKAGERAVAVGKKFKTAIKKAKNNTKKIAVVIFLNYMSTLCVFKQEQHC